MEEWLYTNMYNRKQSKTLSKEYWLKIINLQKGQYRHWLQFQDIVTQFRWKPNIDGYFVLNNMTLKTYAPVQAQRVKQMRVILCQNTFGSKGCWPSEPILWYNFISGGCQLVPPPCSAASLLLTCVILIPTFSCSYSFSAWSACDSSLFYPKPSPLTHNWFIITSPQNTC